MVWSGTLREGGPADEGHDEDPIRRQSCGGCGRPRWLGGGVVVSVCGVVYCVWGYWGILGGDIGGGYWGILGDIGYWGTRILEGYWVLGIGEETYHAEHLAA